MNDPKNFSQLNLIELERLASTWAEEYPIIEKIELCSGKIPPHSGKEPKTHYVFIVRICKRPYREDAEYQNYKDLLEWTCGSCMHIQNELERAYNEAPIGYHLEWAWFNLEPDDELPTEFISSKYPWILYVKEDAVIDVKEDAPIDFKEDASIDRKALDNRIETQEPSPKFKNENALDTRIEIHEPNSKSKKEKVFPCKSGTKWEDVKITLVVDDMVRIKTPQGEGPFTYPKLNMEDGRIGDKPKKIWQILKLFAAHRGRLDNGIQESAKRILLNEYKIDIYKKLPDYTKRLNKHLKDLFGINDSIFKYHYNNYKAYITKIEFSDLREVPKSDPIEFTEKSLHTVEAEDVQDRYSIPDSKRFDA